jgi:hypothetical protein
MHAEKDILDFIIIGAQKSGTTSLFAYLRNHPEIALPVLKEWPFFSHDPAYERGWQTYMSNLRREGYKDAADPARKWGTATPHYTVGGVYQAARGVAVRESYDERTVPLRIQERLPDVRLIAILRDPVERAVSHHRLLVRLGRDRRSFDEAVDELLRPDALEDSRRHPAQRTGYIVWGEYGRILAGYFDVFPREQILVVFTDELKRDPEQVMRRIQQFIGVSSDFAPDDLERTYNAGALERGFSWTDPSSWLSPSSPFSPQGMRRGLSRNPAARAVWDAIPEPRQRRLKRPYEHVANRLARWNRRHPPNEVKANAKPGSAALARLREHYAEDTAQLAALLGVSPSWARSDEPEMTRR